MPLIEYLFALLITVLLFSYVVYYYLQQKNKYKKPIFNIAGCTGDMDSKFYLMIEIKHGKNKDARKLTDKELFFFPKKSIPLLKKTYNSYESAHVSIQELKKQIG